MDELWFLHPILLPSDHAHGLHVVQTCAALARSGARVRLLAKRNPARPAPDARAALAELGVEPDPALAIEWLPRHKAAAGLAARWRVLRAPRGAAFYGTHLRLLATALHRPARAPRIAELHDPVDPQGPAARVLRRAEGVAFTTPALAAWARDALALRAPSAVIPLGVDLSAFSPAKGAGAPRLVYFGHLYPRKGVDVLVRALAKLPELGALVIGGRDGVDPDLARLRALAAELGVGARLELAVRLPQRAIAPRLRASDIAVLPTRFAKGQELAGSLKLFEYGACGLPIVATDTPALRAAGDAVLRFRDGDSRALASRVEELLARPAEREALGRRARALAEAHTWSARARSILAFVDQVAAR